MPCTSIREQLLSLCKLQSLYGMLITGVYLTRPQLNSIDGDLEADDPPCGALGRLLNVPIYSLDDHALRGADLCQDCGLSYSRIPW